MRAFVSYAHADEAWFEAAYRWLARLRHDGGVSFWSDHALRPGETWDATIRSALDAADIVIFLVTQNFEKSDYINHVEVTRAIDGARTTGKLLIPILCEVSTVAHGPLGAFQATPSRGAPPIALAPDNEAAWIGVLAEVMDACKRYREQVDLAAVNRVMCTDPSLAILPSLFPGGQPRSLAALYVELRVAQRVAMPAGRRSLLVDPLASLASRQRQSEQNRKAIGSAPRVRGTDFALSH